MTYYQILQQRRLALQLSIQDISSQTRLAPQYIEAIEENHLEVFNDDYSFIRYFIQSYCEAIGVNWQAIQPQVEANLSAYEQARKQQMAMQKPKPKPQAKKPSSAPKKQTQQRKKAKKQKKNKKKNDVFFTRIRNWNKRMNASKYARTYHIVIIAIVVVLVLSLFNMGVSYANNRRLAAEEAQRQAEIKQKEKQTEQLAKQKTTQEETNNEITLTATDKDNNAYEVSNVVEGSQKLQLTITLPSDSTVAVYKDDELVNSSADKEYSGTFKQTISVDSACLIQVEIGTYDNNKIRLNGKSVSFSKTNWDKGTPAVLYFEVTTSNSTDSTDSSTTDSTATDSTTSTDTTTTDQTTTSE